MDGKALRVLCWLRANEAGIQDYVSLETLGFSARKELLILMNTIHNN